MERTKGMAYCSNVLGLKARARLISLRRFFDNIARLRPATAIPALSTRCCRQTRLREHEMLGANQAIAIAQNQSPFDHVLQFPNVPRPGLNAQQLERPHGQLWRR